MDEYSGSPDCAAITMAKRLRGALDRVHSTGVFGPRPCLPGGWVAPDLEAVFCILRKVPYASLAQKGCACRPTCRASLVRRGDPNPTSRRPASSLHAQSCLIDKDFPALG